ncbi:MAG TPA: Wzz/FepE/Etk N-terminal domain-containing protein [Solirubrobacterales bacterium]|nr:Wzz/FepE/Etk N-terminal domain-containing protein [Solirubrobacterales bacterium]
MEGPSPIETAPPPLRPPEAEAASLKEDGDSRLTVSSAVRNNWVVFLLPIVILVSAAVVAGLLRSPTYTAETRLAVGGLDASSPASNSDFAAAATSLAQTYGRSIQGDAVVNAVARETESTPEAVRAQISAFTVPSTPLFSVTAVASSPGTAIALANLASRALGEAANSATEDVAQPLLERYRRAEIARQRVEREVRYLEATGQDGDLVSARAKLAIAQTRAASAREAFVAGEQRQQTLAVPVEIIERANSASNDRYSTLQLWIFTALVLGLIVGTALALFRESQFLRYAAAT